ncbi:MAG: AAA family ATPase, partial [bacterium]|nr:AAA family ATPase [bacterium]
KASQKGALFTSIIGRRRIGKTRLWMEAIEKRQGSLYLFCLPGHIYRTFEQVESQLYELGFTSVPRNLTQFFKAVDLILSKGMRISIFFDEVQNLFLDKKDELALFQYYIDSFKRKRHPCMIVFCGSVKTLLHQILFEEHSPLYGRLDQKIQLKPLGFYTLRQLFYDHNVDKSEQHLRLFSMFGTNPRFYETLVQFDLLKSNTDKILEKGWLGLTGIFSDELNKMLLPELKKSSHVYTGILSAMAKGIQDANEIASHAGIHATSLANYLPFLLNDLELVDKEIQITEKPNSKLSRYLINDPFILFWYRYVQKNLALLEMRQTSSVLRRIADDLPNHEGRVLEMIFREKILAQPPMEFDVAGSVFKNREGIEIDFLLASQKANRIHAYEIKRGKVNRDAELNRLIGKTARLTFKSIKLNNPQITGEILHMQNI